MIYTVTLNPALDHYLEVDDLVVDDANRVKVECLYAGGKGIDVSRALRQLGGEGMALGFIGGHNGRLMVDMLKAQGVSCYFTPIAQETRRDILICAGRGNRRTQTMLNARGPVVTPEEWRGFLTHLRLLDLRNAYVVASGSLPRGVPSDAYYQIVMAVQSQGARAIVDADGAALRAALKARPFAIKPNLNELRRATGRLLRTEADILAIAGDLNRAGVEIVVVSRGRRGVLVVSRGERYRAIPPPVKVRSTVGAGDSTVAGFVWKHAGGKSLEECARFAAAAGTAATLAPGNQLCRLRDAQRLAPKIRVEKLGGRDIKERGR
jgi:6-phosphofructokinase 2